MHKWFWRNTSFFPALLWIDIQCASVAKNLVPVSRVIENAANWSTKSAALKFHVWRPPKSCFYLAALCCQGRLKGTLISGALARVYPPRPLHHTHLLHSAVSLLDTPQGLSTDGSWAPAGISRRWRMWCHVLATRSHLHFPSCDFAEWIRLRPTWSRYLMAPQSFPHRHSVPCVITGADELMLYGFSIRGFCITACLCNFLHFRCASLSNVLQYLLGFFFWQAVLLKPSQRCFPFFVKAMCVLW